MRLMQDYRFSWGGEVSSSGLLGSDSVRTFTSVVTLQNRPLMCPYIMT